MKAQGLTISSFNSAEKIQEMLIEHRLHSYENHKNGHINFFAAFETYSMVQSASQVDDTSHIKNDEVMRIQAFSRSLMGAIL